jgi:superfamily II DNA/RNA helicase
MSFEELNLHPSIQKAVAGSGYDRPTPIQQQAIPAIIAGQDLLASAQTGTGKTAAFILPALQRLMVRSESRSRGPRILVLTPTRELAQQIHDAASKYGKYVRYKSTSIVGGMPFMAQNRALANGVDLLIATPGRLIDHIQQGHIDFSRLEMLVLDEADRMLDMGFVADVKRIAKATPETRQTLLFSATLDSKIIDLAKDLLRDPKRIEIATARERHEGIEQRLHHVDGLSHKMRLLVHLLAQDEVSKAIVFTSTKRGADKLADDLDLVGFEAAALHGNMSQNARNRTIEKMRRGHVNVLVATDVAARGIDIGGVTHVFNFDLPNTAEDYVHRIGRTGRAGALGLAISFAGPRDSGIVRDIERYTGRAVDAHVIPGYEPERRPARQNDRRPGPSQSRGYSVNNSSSWDRRFEDKKRGGGGSAKKDGRGSRSFSR